MLPRGAALRQYLWVQLWREERLRSLAVLLLPGLHIAASAGQAWPVWRSNWPLQLHQCASAYLHDIAVWQARLGCTSAN